MQLEEEARKLERQIEGATAEGLGSLSDLPDVKELRPILRNGVDEFEETLAKLPRDQQEAAYILYLQKIRETTCAMHIAVDSLVSKKRLGPNPPDEGMFADNPYVVPRWHCIAQLYLLA